MVGIRERRYARDVGINLADARGSLARSRNSAQARSTRAFALPGAFALRLIGHHRFLSSETRVAALTDAQASICDHRSNVPLGRPTGFSPAKPIGYFRYSNVVDGLLRPLAMNSMHCAMSCSDALGVAQCKCFVHRPPAP